MDTIAWILQILLALAFGMAGFMKISQSKEKLAVSMAWVNDFSATQIKGIGLLEILGILGLILPSVTRILPVLTPIAAVGLMLTMVGAAYAHYRRGETKNIIANAVLFILCAAVAYARFVVVPLA